MQRSGVVAINGSLRRLLAKPAVNARALGRRGSGSPGQIHAFRPFHATNALRTSRDKSTIDFAYMPQHDLDEPASSEVIRIPLLPDNFNPVRDFPDHEEVIVSVAKPEISTVSANGTHIDSPSAMSDVTDNHAVEIDPYELTNQVTTAASKVTGIAPEDLKERGVIREFWNGLVDDVFGPKKVSTA